MRDYFISTERIGFSKWGNTDLDLATLLWGEKDVTNFICATGKFTDEDIKNRLKLEIFNEMNFHIQYWPIFELATGELIGCCGIRPFKSEKHDYEIGFHLRKKYWGKGYAYEAATAAISYSFNTLDADKLYAGHHPQNEASRKLLHKLGFKDVGNNYYEPTGLYHPSYELINNRL